MTSLLTPDEVAELELQDEAARSHEEGLEFHAFPIPDRGVPRSRVDWAKLVSRLEKALESGKTVAVHCRQGIGRSSLVVASLLVSAGQEPDEAFRRIEKARGRPVPDTTEQREWVAQSASEEFAATGYGNYTEERESLFEELTLDQTLASTKKAAGPKSV